MILEKTNLADLNKQLKYVKNNSSLVEYGSFQDFLRKSNKNSPIKYFGRDYQRVVDIESLTFVRKSDGTLIGKARDFVRSEIPSEVSVRYRIITKINSVNVSNERYLVKVKFKFAGIDIEKRAGSRLDFMITGYKIYKIK